MRNYRDLNDQGHVAVLIEMKGKNSLVLNLMWMVSITKV